jgi:CRISPR-associated protein Cas2
VERPGAAAARQSATDELFTLVAFDVSCDKARHRLGEMCKDYGLKRAQWSVFEGTMTRNRREELSARIEQLLGSAEGGGRAAVYPIGKQEAVLAVAFLYPPSRHCVRERAA